MKKWFFIGESRYTCESYFKRDNSNVIFLVDKNTLEIRNKKTGVVTILTFSYYGHCINAVTE